MATQPMQKQMKCLVSWVTYDPKFLPTMQCQVGLYFLSNSFLMKAQNYLSEGISYGDILLDIEFFKGLVGTIYGILLHFLRHVCVLDNCFPIGHFLNFVFFFLYSSIVFYYQGILLMKNKTHSVIQSGTNPNTARLSTEPSCQQNKQHYVAPHGNTRYFYKSKLLTNRMGQNSTKSTITQTMQPVSSLHMEPEVLKTHLRIESSSLQRQIESKKTERKKVISAGIQTVSKLLLRKQDDKYEFSRQRIKEPQVFRHLVGAFQNKLKSVPKEIEALQKKCKNKEFLKRAATKYFTIQHEQVGEEIKSGKISIADVLEGNLKHSVRQTRSKDIKHKIKSQVHQNTKQFDNQIHYMKINPNFDMDSMFQIDSRHFNKFEQANAIDRKFGTIDVDSKQNVYLSYYLDSQRKHCYYQQPPHFLEKYQEQTIPSYQSLSSVDEECIQEAMDNVNEQEMQYHNYKTNIRNPFIENKDLLQIMKRTGILKSIIKKKL